MKPRIVVIRPMPDPLMAELREEFEVTWLPNLLDPNDAAFREAVAKADGVIGGSLKLDRALLDSAPGLRVVSSVSVGYDNYDVPALTERDILLTNTPDVLTETTADTAFMLLMMASRRALELAEYVKAGRWTRSVGPAEYGSDVHHKTLGIVGMGRIGTALARRAKLGFGMPILYHNRSPHAEAEADLGARRLPLDDLLREADIVAVVVPLSPETTHLIGAREFELMGPQTVFVNISRGQVVDEAALAEALRAGKIRAAGLDVFEKEPLPLSSPLLALPNAVCLPHIGSATHETRGAMSQCAADNLRAALRGERPPNLVNPEAWERRASRPDPFK